MIRTLLLAVLLLAAKSYCQKAISNDEFAQQETSVAISRTDPNRILVGSNDDAMDVRSMPAYLTTDGGKTWDTYRIPKVPIPYHAIGDPVVIADNDGGFYYANLLYHDATGWYNILVSHSENGKTWTYNAPVVKEPTGAIEDKEWIALDRSPQSPTYGRLYITWTRLDQGNQSRSGTFISWSDDTGKTWSDAKRIASVVGTFSEIQIGNDGSIYVSYSQFREQDSAGHFMAISHDFGSSFIEHRIANFLNYPYNLGIGKSTLKGGKLISFPYQSFAIDPSSQSLHLTFGSFDLQRAAATQYYVTSTDSGASWSKPRIIGDPASLDRDRFQPWLTLTKKSPIVFYYSSEKDENNLLTAPYLARVLPDTIACQSIGDSVFDPLLALDFHGDPFIGDYTGADVSGNTFAASWTQNRTGYKDGEIFVYVDPDIDSLKNGVVSIIRPAQFIIESVTPNPVTDRAFQMKVRSLLSGSGSLEILDERGVVVLRELVTLEQGENSTGVHLLQLASGTYFIRLTLNQTSTASAIVVR